MLAATVGSSSLNALKHGFTAHNTTLLACENPDEFQSLLDDYVTTYRPSGGMEKRLVAEACAAHWRILRLRTIETSLMDFEMIRQEPELEKKLTRFDVGIQLAVAFQALADESRAISLISRYESRLPPRPGTHAGRPARLAPAGNTRGTNPPGSSPSAHPGVRNKYWPNEPGARLRAAPQALKIERLR